jgi:Sulfotransferase family
MHILVVNGRKVRHPVFVIGAPHSGTELVARALKRSTGFHVTIGQPSVMHVVYAFARRPSISRGREEAAASVLRDAFAQAWRLSPDGCSMCSPACRLAGGVTATAGTAGTAAGRTAGANAKAEPPEPCVTEQSVARYGDASPELLYCAEVLIDAFPDARFVQVIRDGRDVVAGMLGDSDALTAFRPGFANLDSEFPNPFLGIESETDRAGWDELSLAGKCAMRWRSAVRMSARLRYSLSAQQLATLRYEEIVSKPDNAAGLMSEFVGARVSAIALRDPHPHRALEPGAWRRTLSSEQATEVENIAGAELRRVGYGE